MSQVNDIYSSAIGHSICTYSMDSNMSLWYEASFRGRKPIEEGGREKEAIFSVPFPGKTSYRIGLMYLWPSTSIWLFLSQLKLKFSSFIHQMLCGCILDSWAVFPPWWYCPPCLGTGRSLKIPALQQSKKMSKRDAHCYNFFSLFKIFLKWWKVSKKF